MNLDLTVGQVNEDTDDPSALQRIGAPREDEGGNGDPDNRWRPDPLLATQVVCYKTYYPRCKMLLTSKCGRYVIIWGLS